MGLATGEDSSGERNVMDDIPPAKEPAFRDWDEENANDILVHGLPASSLMSIFEKVLRKDNPDVVKHALRTLKHLLQHGGPEIRQQIGGRTKKFQGPTVVAKAMLHNVVNNNVEIFTMGCWVLGYLAIDKQASETLATDGAVVLDSRPGL